MATLEDHLKSARSFLNEASNSLSLAGVEVDALQKKADSLAPTAAEFEKATEKLAVTNSALAQAESKLAAVRSAHANFAKLVTG